MSEVADNFLDAFGDALSVDGETHNFVFSNGVTTPIFCLWVKDVSNTFHTHTHGYEETLYQNQRLVLIRESDVPSDARMKANDFLTIDGARYKIVTARLRDFIWTLTLLIMSV